MKHFLVFVLIVLAILVALPARGDAWLGDPIYWRANSPFVVTHGLPRARPGEILASGEQVFALNIEAANSFTRQTTSRLDMQLDGETSLITLDWKFGIGAYELGIEVPWMRHHTGFLDGLIDTYHDISGLPEKDRGKFPEDQLDFTWTYDGVTLASVQSERSGVGDIRIRAGRELGSSSSNPLVVRAELKLPTGDAGDLTGSGAMDLSVSVAQSRSAEVFSIPLTIHLGGGLMYIGSGDIAHDFQNRVAALGFTSIAANLGERWSVIAQADAHTALYDIDHSVPGSWSIQGGVALRRAFGQSWSTELVIYEDLRPGSATDFTLALRIRLRPR